MLCVKFSPKKAPRLCVQFLPKKSPLLDHVCMLVCVDVMMLLSTYKGAHRQHHYISDSESLMGLKLKNLHGDPADRQLGARICESLTSVVLCYSFVSLFSIRVTHLLICYKICAISMKSAPCCMYTNY